MSKDVTEYEDVVEELPPSWRLVASMAEEIGFLKGAMAMIKVVANDDDGFEAVVPMLAAAMDDHNKLQASRQRVLENS